MKITKKQLQELLASEDENFELDLGEQPKADPIFIKQEIATEIPVFTPFTSVKHSTNLGDIIASMAACKKYYDVTKRKIRFLQRVNMQAAYYPGATHGTVDSSGNMVTLNETLFERIKPLIESQEYIESMQLYNGQDATLDFDVIRGKTFVNMPHGSIQAWLFYAFPDLDYDISKPWMFLPNETKQIEEVVKNKVIINFTERYRNNQVMLDYFFLKEYAPDLIFAGTEKEHWNFCNQWQINIPLLEEKNFLDTAHALKSCRFLYSNQSFLWNLATALGIPRVLEVCPFAQNCLPFYGEDNVGYLQQLGGAYLFRRMYNKTARK